MRLIAPALVAMMFLAGCGADRACVPGESRACVGPGGCAGGQRCDAEGDAFGECVCAGEELCGTDVCRGTELCCDGSCADVSSDAMNCGGCRIECADACVRSVCEIRITIPDSGS